MGLILFITLRSSRVVFMGLAVGSRVKSPDVGIPVLRIELKVKVAEHDSSFGSSWVGA